MKCEKCGALIKEGAQFCRECGNKVITKTEVLDNRSCPECGNIVEDNALFCNNCGYKFRNNQDVNEATDNICPKCGKILKENAEFCGECGTKLNKVSPQKEYKTANKKRKDGGITILIIILIAVIVSCVGIVLFIISNNHSYNIDTPQIEDSAYEKEEEINNNENGKYISKDDNDEETTVSEYSARPQIDNISEEVSYIRELYNKLQQNIESCSVDNSAPNVKKYYDINRNLVRIDVSTNEMNYTRYYYFNNGKLYFAFVFEGNKENRFYIKDNTLFRWIDEQGNTHDNDSQNLEFLSWEKDIIQEAKRYSEE